MWMRNSLLSRMEVVVLCSLFMMFTLGRCSPINPSISKSSLREGRETQNVAKDSVPAPAPSGPKTDAKLPIHVIDPLLSPDEIFKSVSPKAIVLSDENNVKEFGQLLATGQAEITLKDAALLAHPEHSAAFVQLAEDASLDLIRSAATSEVLLERSKDQPKTWTLTLKSPEVLENLVSLTISPSGEPHRKTRPELFLSE